MLAIAAEVGIDASKVRTMNAIQCRGLEDSSAVTIQCAIRQWRSRRNFRRFIVNSAQSQVHSMYASRISRAIRSHFARQVFESLHKNSYVMPPGISRQGDASQCTFKRLPSSIVSKVEAGLVAGTGAVVKILDVGLNPPLAIGLQSSSMSIRGAASNLHAGTDVVGDIVRTIVAQSCGERAACSLLSDDTLSLSKIRMTCTDCKGANDNPVLGNTIDAINSRMMANASPNYVDFDGFEGTKQPKAGASLVLDLGYGRAAVLSAYCIAHSSQRPMGALRHWVLQGSVNGTQWKNICIHHADTSLQTPGKPYWFHVHSFPSHFPTPGNPSAPRSGNQRPALHRIRANAGPDAVLQTMSSDVPAFRFFRLAVTGPNSAGNFKLCCESFSLYGSLILRGSPLLAMSEAEIRTSKFPTQPYFGYASQGSTLQGSLHAVGDSLNISPIRQQGDTSMRNSSVIRPGSALSMTQSQGGLRPGSALSMTQSQGGLRSRPTTAGSWTSPFTESTSALELAYMGASQKVLVKNPHVEKIVALMDINNLGDVSLSTLAVRDVLESRGFSLQAYQIISKADQPKLKLYILPYDYIVHSLHEAEQVGVVQKCIQLALYKTKEITSRAQSSSKARRQMEDALGFQQLQQSLVQTSLDGEEFKIDEVFGRLNSASRAIANFWKNLKMKRRSDQSKKIQALWRGYRIRLLFADLRRLYTDSDNVELLATSSKTMPPVLPGCAIVGRAFGNTALPICGQTSLRSVATTFLAERTGMQLQDDYYPDILCALAKEKSLGGLPNIHWSESALPLSEGRDESLFSDSDGSELLSNAIKRVSDAWLILDFGLGRAVAVSAFGFSPGLASQMHFPLGWRLEGSTDAKYWTNIISIDASKLIDSSNLHECLKKSLSSSETTVSNILLSGQTYRFLRFSLTRKTSSNSLRLCLRKLQLQGFLLNRVRWKHDYCETPRSHYTPVPGKALQAFGAESKDLQEQSSDAPFRVRTMTVNRSGACCDDLISQAASACWSVSTISPNFCVLESISLNFHPSNQIKDELLDNILQVAAATRALRSTEQPKSTVSMDTNSSVISVLECIAWCAKHGSVLPIAASSLVSSEWIASPPSSSRRQICIKFPKPSHSLKLLQKTISKMISALGANSSPHFTLSMGFRSQQEMDLASFLSMKREVNEITSTANMGAGNAAVPAYFVAKIRAALIEQCAHPILLQGKMSLAYKLHNRALALPARKEWLRLSLKRYAALKLQSVVRGHQGRIQAAVARQKIMEARAMTCVNAACYAHTIRRRLKGPKASWKAESRKTIKRRKAWELSWFVQRCLMRTSACAQIWKWWRRKQLRLFILNNLHWMATTKTRCATCIQCAWRSRMARRDLRNQRLFASLIPMSEIVRANQCWANPNTSESYNYIAGECEDDEKTRPAKIGSRSPVKVNPEMKAAVKTILQSAAFGFTIPVVALSPQEAIDDTLRLTILGSLQTYGAVQLRGAIPENLRQSAMAAIHGYFSMDLQDRIGSERSVSLFRSRRWPPQFLKSKVNALSDVIQALCRKLDSQVFMDEYTPDSASSRDGTADVFQICWQPAGARGMGAVKVRSHIPNSKFSLLLSKGQGFQVRKPNGQLLPVEPLFEDSLVLVTGSGIHLKEVVATDQAVATSEDTVAEQGTVCRYVESKRMAPEWTCMMYHYMHQNSETFHSHVKSLRDQSPQEAFSSDDLMANLGLGNTPIQSLHRSQENSTHAISPASTAGIPTVGSECVGDMIAMTNVSGQTEWACKSTSFSNHS